MEAVMRSRLSWLTGVIAALAWASTASAQQPISSLEALGVLQHANSKVTVTDTSGQDFSGTITEASANALSIRIGDAVRQFPAANVRTVRVRREDSLANGALIGAAVTGGLASLAFLDNDCRDEPVCYGFVATYAGFGALIGVAIDYVKERRGQG